MAEQNANAVAITGGTVNNATIGATTATTGAFTTLTSTGGAVNGTIGATTPATGTFTTITGQTARVNGTGTNLFLYSEQFDNAYWSKSNVTITANSTTAPDGNVTADSLIENSATSEHGINNNAGTTIVANTTNIASCYIKANGRTKGTIKYVLNTFATQVAADFDLTAGTISAAYIALGSGSTNLVSSISNVGNGWYRVSVGAIIDSSSTSVRSQILLSNGSSTTYTGNGTSGFFIWGAQFELGSTANTYIPTTTTAVYGTPTLSFSGVAGLGLESNGALYVSPAGTGALQAQATTSSTVGGNARGANAVDWQTSRDGATQVASGLATVIGGGSKNIASSLYSGVASGLGNTSSNLVTVVAGGQGNTANGGYSAIVGGISNNSAGYLSFIGGGQASTSAGYYNFIGGGFTNSGTANAAVTTQSGTMNATTAVTLSGSNASIKVGQYITGTSIAGDTYVAAISGTALTLSKVASGSSTSTLSFFTPHGVVVGGGNNQATGSYSAILGGGDAGTAANRNVASGDWSVVCGGQRNTASGGASFVGGGGNVGSSTYPNTASGTAASIVGGLQNTASGFGSFVGGGYNNTANAQYSAIMGGAAGTTRSILGNHVFPACIEPISGVGGVSQAALLVLGVQTTDATATALRSTTAAAGTTNQVILPNNSAYFFRGEVVSGVTGGGDTKAWVIEGAIKRGANAGTTALVGTPTVVSGFADVGAATWVIAVTADTTNGGIRVTFTGQLATTIRTVCQIRTTEMTY
jgi:hypothetical protein